MTHWLLAAVLRLLPAGRRDWGRAMRAEVAAIDRDQARWRFALSCVRVVVTRPVVLRRAGHPLLAVAALAGAFGWTSRMAYPPLRWGAFGLAVLLLAVAWGGRTLGPVGRGRAARLVRAGGILAVGGMTVEFVTKVVGKGDPTGKVGAPLSIFTVLMTSLLVAVLAVTATRSAATGRVLATGVGAGTAAGALWTAIVLLTPPIPADVGLGLTLTTVAIAVAVLTNAGERGGPVKSLLAALLAGTVAQLLIFLLVVLLSAGPAVLIPDLAPAALSPADDLADSRLEIVDPYVALLIFGGLTAMALSVVSLTTRNERTPVTAG